MLVDLLHKYTDRGPGSPPCGLVALTVDLPATTIVAGMAIDGRVRWPEVGEKDRWGRSPIVCGTCGGYAGECLVPDCALPHTCVPVDRPDGRGICRAGCDGGRR